MSEDRKKPVWPWIVALSVGLPVLYVASFGPAIWLWDRGIIPMRGWAKSAIEHTYGPVWLVEANAPEPISKAIRWYQRLGCERRVKGVIRTIDVENDP